MVFNFTTAVTTIFTITTIMLIITATILIITTTATYTNWNAFKMI